MINSSSALFALLALVSFGEPRIVSTGSVVATTSVTLSAQVAAEVVEVKADVGDLVKKGSVVITLDDHLFAAEVAASSAARDEAYAAKMFAKTRFDRVNKLLEQGSGTKSAFDEAKTGLLQSKAGLARADANLRKAETIFSYTTIVSPLTGAVDIRSVEPGELTAPGSHLMTITDVHNLRFETKVKESDINNVTVGDKVKLFIDALPKHEFEGVVAHIAPSGDPSSHSFLVAITIAPEKRGAIRIGMYGKAEWK